MYYCNNCNDTFENYDTIDDLIGEYCGENAYETWLVCPHCNESDFDEAERCQNCSEWTNDVICVDKLTRIEQEYLADYLEDIL